MSVYDLIIEGFMILFVVSGVKFSSNRIRKIRQLITVPVHSISEATVGDRIAVSGTAAALRAGNIDDSEADSGLVTIEAPITGRECLLASWSIQEFGGSWSTLDKGVKSVPFEVRNEGSSLRVGVDDTLVEDFWSLYLNDQYKEVLYHRGDEQPPERVAQFLHERDVREPHVSPLSPDWEEIQGDRRYREPIVEPGDDLFIVGTVEQSRSSTDSSSLCVRLTADAESLLTNRGRKAVIKTHIIFGSVVVAVSLVILYYFISKYSLLSVVSVW